MSDRRQVWATLAALLRRLENGAGQPTDVESLKQEVRKLGKEQFKANALAESQVTRWQEALAAWQTTQTQHAHLLEKSEAERQTAVLHALLSAILPALDGVEHALQSGEQYLASAVGSPGDREALHGWINGLRLVQERLLAILESGGVTPITAVGHPFDPFLHKAVGVSAVAESADTPPGTILQEERRGYRSPNGVLRYAEVIVYKPPVNNKQRPDL